MKKLLTIITPIVLLVSCYYHVDDLDNIKEFNAENKYFKAG